MTDAAVQANRTAWASLFAAWLIALLASLAVLFVGEVMGQTPCNLCWFQRAFMFPLAIVLGVAALRIEGAVWRYALPLAVGGALVAAFHSLLYLGVIPERITPCSQGVSCSSADMTILGGLPLPMLALAAFCAIAVLLLVTRSRTST
ncbi:disulfide bond formation protein B [Comamonas flocculans]|uniref:Disulfide bond formation protein B n=1 Tax=Comamonas flocculans TaxID=2597701 RepID=A0A5B8RUA3_9BURK|nr:disulfide bond formation protein B [Comamonas flocculans]MBZ0134452.1 disulfide bond formation protein B [Rhodanobacter sp.]QEA12312.1 disulfide bond formation protein B [Comamonas flocculans]